MSFVRRKKIWASRVGKYASCCPKLYSLPLPSESFAENVKRAHPQACVWKQATESDAPEIQPVNFGWRKNEDLKPRVPVMLPTNVALAPPEINC